MPAIYESVFNCIAEVQISPTLSQCRGWQPGDKETNGG